MKKVKFSQQAIWIMIILLLTGCNTPTATPAPALPTTTYTSIPSTATPILATSTATLTVIATPTSSPTATNTVAASDPYLDEVNISLQAYQDAFANASNYVQAPVSDFNVLLDQNWKQQANMALGQLDEVAEQLENINNVPPEQMQLDMYLKSIAGETHKLVENYGNGLNNLDPNAISMSISNLTNISSYLNSATTELNKYYRP